MNILIMEKGVDPNQYGKYIKSCEFLPKVGDKIDSFIKKNMTVVSVSTTVHDIEYYGCPYEAVVVVE